MKHPISEVHNKMVHNFEQREFSSLLALHLLAASTFSRIIPISSVLLLLTPHERDIKFRWFLNVTFPSKTAPPSYSSWN